MQQALLALQVLVAVALIAIILLQQGRGADAGAAFGSGTSGSIFGARGPASFLAKITALLAAVFFANSLMLAYIGGRNVERTSVVERFGEVPGVSAPAASEPSPDAPAPGETAPPAEPQPDSDVPSIPQGQ